ncbi:MAG: sulfotransferase [Actinomycetota bacterium]
MPFPPAPKGGFAEDRVVWVFGHPRSGTTWLGQLLTDGLALKMWNEPYLGQFLNFSNLLRENEPKRYGDPTFWMSDPQEENWRASLNTFFMDVIARQGGPAAGFGGLVVKEPNGTMVAPVILKAMPRAKAIFMLRDPRDVIASLIDARKPGSWMDERLTQEFDRTKIVKQSIRRFEKIAEVLAELEATAPDRFYEMRYERLRADTFAEMQHLAHVLALPCDESVLKRAVERHAYERIPAERKGPGRFVRTARVGGWAEELEEGEIAAVHRRLGAFLAGRGYPQPQGPAGKP